MHKNKSLLIILMGFLFLNIVNVSANEAYWNKQGKAINQLIQLAQDQYQKGDSKQAKRTIIKAYFTEFEDRKVEAAMRMELGAKYTYLVEKRFGSIRKLITKNAPIEEVQALSQELQGIISQDMPKLDKAGIAPEVFKVNQ